MSRAAIDDVVAQLGAEDIRITVTRSGEALVITVDATEWSDPLAALGARAAVPPRWLELR